MKDIITKRRRELGLTQQELADKLFVSDKVVSKWETGKSIPDTTILLDLSKALEISVNELLGSESLKNANTSNSIDKIVTINKLKNFTIIYICLQLIASFLIIFGRQLIEDYSNEIYGVITSAIGYLIELITITYFLVSRNNLFTKFNHLKSMEVKYINIILVVTFILYLLIGLVYIIWYGLEVNEQILSFIIFVFILLIPFTIMFILNNKKK